MDKQFWLERWAQGQIGFHQARPNEYLLRHWSCLGIAPGATVLVPLCGKSLDMHWLREQGYRVLGIELAREAVSEFFEEWQLEPRICRQGAYERWEATNPAPRRAAADPGGGAAQVGSITVLCGDFFDLEPRCLADVAGVFDRAALIALPAPMRIAYARKLHETLPEQVAMLLITLDYDQAQMSGPPFAVGNDEVRELFAHCRVQLLEEADVSEAEDHARFRQRGVTRLIERVYRIDKLAP